MTATTVDHYFPAAPIVVGTDGSEAGGQAVRWAAETAAAGQRPLRIVHAADLTAAHILLDPCDPPMSSVTEAIREFGADCLSAAKLQARAIDPALAIETAVVDGTAAAGLIEESATAHLTAIGAVGLSGGGLFGSTVLTVAAHARGPVVVVRDAGSEQPTRGAGPVVVGVDDSEYSRAAVASAFAEADERHAELVVVHCWSDLRFGWFAGLPDVLADGRAYADAQELINEQLVGWQEKYPSVSVRRKIYLSGPSHHLLGWSTSAQLVVVANRGRGGFPGLRLGSTGNALIQCARCPVVVVHQRIG
ncbi:universal stress protein [Nocardia mangyaensis]|uniref:Universal stress protein n=1 Tax=Nocardia mangyaensis TaxID=2213200 RepID=A0A1J0VSE2_9NOCA|nr:universal stress protein [Nocardia mangyaensis]APE34863.1 universal stress protein [Nocardia mangyaensis]